MEDNYQDQVGDFIRQRLMSVNNHPHYWDKLNWQPSQHPDQHYLSQIPAISTNKYLPVDLKIEKYLHMFNSSLCKIGDDLQEMVMAVRCDQPPQWGKNSTIWLVKLAKTDENFKQKGEAVQQLHEPDIRNIPRTNPLSIGPGQQIEDPRLFLDGQNRLRMHFTDGYKMFSSIIDAETLEMKESWPLTIFKRQEKNWTPFCVDQREFCVYKIADDNNHIVFEYDRDKKLREFRSPVHLPSDWSKFEPRGGCICDFDDKSMIHVFHAQVNLPTMSKAYVMGFYLFEKEPPFKVTQICKIPLYVPKACDPVVDRMSRRLHVIYPCGIVRDEDVFYVSCGLHDWKTVVFRFTRQELCDFLNE
jgi:predicted GH43/DUF377 family glycosyl hydrolase